MTLVPPSASRLPGQYIYPAASLLINLLVALRVAQVLHSPAYQPSAYLHLVLAWAVGVNIACTLSYIGLQLTRKYPGVRLWLLDCAMSLLPLVLIRIVRIPQPNPRLHLFGLTYSLLIFGRLLFLYGGIKLLRQHDRASLRLAIFVASFIIYCAIAPWVQTTAWTTGDEPHYLLLTHSLLHDHDFDLRNNYDKNDYRVFYPPDMTARHIVINGRGAQMPFHDVGLSIVLVPGYALAGRLGAMLELSLFAALLAMGIFELAWRLGASTSGAIDCWLLFAFVSPLITFSAQIYPECIAGALAIWAAVEFHSFTKTHKASDLLVAGCLLSLLPWFSIRYWVVLGPMMLAIAGFVVAAQRSSRSVVPLLYLATPTMLSLLAFCLLDLHLFGIFRPNAGYLLYVPTMTTPMFRPRLHTGVLGLFLDREFGLLPTAPIYLLAIAGIWPALRNRNPLAITLLAPMVATVLFTGANRWWYGGNTPPALRYLVAIVGLLAPFAGPLLSSAKSKIAITILAVWSFLVAIQITALPVPRHSFWNPQTTGIASFLQRNLHLDPGALFPSLIRAEARDYLLAILWIVTAVGVVYNLLRTTEQPHNHDSADAPIGNAC